LFHLVARLGFISSGCRLRDVTLRAELLIPLMFYFSADVSHAGSSLSSVTQM